ncbi:MAG: acyl-CoA dehydrogenase family protein [Pseudomonadales bacterium]|nr:acyl-CoA dehydrogenase family protein [Pseudomonadales bacterium]
MNGHRRPTFEELRQRADALVPRLRERAQAAEIARRVPDETVRELVAAQLFEVQKPAAFGGYELGLVEFVELVAELGRGCGSTAWVYGVTAERAWLLAKFPERAQRDVWDRNPAALITSSITPDGKAVPAEGGYRVTGHWRFVSGIDFADWAVFCTWLPPVAGAGGPVATYVVVPVADCEIIDTWHVAGLAATGSRDARLTDVFVPMHRLAATAELRAGGGPGISLNAAPLFKLPLIAINPYAIVAPALGIATGALEQYMEAARTRNLVRATGTLAQQQLVQLRVAEAAAEIEAARALILQDCREAMATVERGAEVSVDQRIHWRRNQGFAVKLLTAAIDRLFAASGGRGIYLDHYMQRSFRDMHAAASHLGLSWDVTGTMWGQHAMGLPVDNPSY